MSSEYSYDEEGQFFPFFLLTLTGIITLPLTWTVLAPTKSQATLAHRTQASSKYEAQHGIPEVHQLRTAHKRKMRKVRRTIMVVLGWAVMAWMSYLILSTQRVMPKLWNPYDILGVSDSADETQIKRHFKKLSIKFHPDKVRPDPAKNETLESLNQRYVEMTKAYEALTDEDVRNNWLQYGHPDGRQGFSMGISLPKFIVAEGNGKYVILFYTLLLGVILPYYVGSWWYGWQRMSKDGILMESANNLFRQYEDSIDEAGMVTAVTSGKEFKDMIKGDKGDKTDADLSKIESKVQQLMPAKEQDKLEQMDDSARRKALALLWAYLGRVDLGDKALNMAKYQVAPIGQRLVKAFTTMTLAFGNTTPIVASYVARQHIIQAMLPGSSPLLQLPNFTPAVVKAVEGDSKVHTTVQQLMQIPDASRRNVVVGPGLLTKKQYDEAMAVASEMPHFRVAKAFFKVTGERFITPGSLVSLVVKGRFVPPGCKSIPDINELDLEDVDPAEDDLDANTGRKKKVKGPDGKWKVVEDLKISPNVAHAPYFAQDHLPSWFVFLADSKSGKMAVPPFSFNVFDQPIFDKESKPTFNMQTLKAQFAAPPGPGHYTFAMHLVCDSFVGLDTKAEVTLVVEDASKAAKMVAEDDISDPEEDSLAGQMASMKGGTIKKSKVRQEDSDDESGTDDDVDEDTSATNTDTDEE